MLSYIIGKIISINKKSITLENNYMGLVIYATHLEKYEINKVKKIYVYKHITSNNKNNLVEQLYGFIEYEQKELFLNLININGIGPKTALNICANDTKTIIQLISQRDVESLGMLGGITPKYARLIMDNLYEIYTKPCYDNDFNFGDLIKALKSLGYSSTDVEYAIKKLDASLASNELSDLIAKAIKLIASQQNAINEIKAN
jgi:Holliday junction DNA helicase RuvA